MAQMYLPYLMCGYAATVLVMLAGCYVISRTVRGLRGLRLLVWALCCSLLAVVLVAIRPLAPEWISILAAHQAAIIAWLLVYCATVEILDTRRTFLPWGLGVLVAAGAGMFWFTYIHDRMSARIIISSASFAIFASARAVVLFRHREPACDPVSPAAALRSLQNALALLQLLMIVVQAARVVVTVKYPPSDIVHIDIVQAGFTYLNMVMNAGAGFGLIWLGLTLHRRDLHRIAQTDSLTGLLNRRAFEEILSRELMRSNRLESPLSVLLVDIDRFKHVNDTWGHHAGDEVLRRVGEALRYGLRPGDALSRYGGEEFLILLRDATPAQSEEVAGRLRERIACLRDLPGSVRLTVSIGVAASRSHDGAEDLLQRCDEAMYRSKRGGRNLVTVDRSPTDRQGPAAAQASA